MACGTPVVATPAGALVEVIEQTGGGVLADRDEPTALAAAIRRLLADPEARASMAERGRASVVADLSWPGVAQKTAEVYDEVVERARRGRPTTTTTSASEGH
jgi:starch synthase